MNRKGELTTQQLVTLIILIVSFGIILFLIFNLGLGETTNKEICHNSVLLKSKSVIGGELDCKTNYVCISGGGDCEGFNEDYTIKIDMEPKPTEEKTKEVLIKEDIMKAIAEEMADCWWMFGEGKVDYVGGIKAIDNNVCSLCSVVAIDKNINIDKIPYTAFYNYLKTTKKDKYQTYLNYLFEVNEVVDTQNFLGAHYFEPGKKYSVITGLSKEGVFSSIVGHLNFGKGIRELISGDGTEKEKLENLRIVVLEQSEINEILKCYDFITKA